MNKYVVSTHGQLLRYEQKRCNNWFHVETIINNAVTSVMWVKKQVSFGTGKNIMARLALKNGFGI